MGYYMVFRGKGRGFSCRHQSIKVVLHPYDLGEKIIELF